MNVTSRARGQNSERFVASIASTPPALGMQSQKRRTQVDNKELDIAALIPFGRVNAASQSHLASITGLRPRTVRQLIQLARLDGVPIVSSPRGGYWRAETTDNVRRYVERERRSSKEIGHYFRKELLFDLLYTVQNTVIGRSGFFSESTLCFRLFAKNCWNIVESLGSSSGERTTNGYKISHIGTPCMRNIIQYS